MTSYTTSSSVQTHVLGKDSQATPSFVSLLELKIEKPAPPKNPITIAIIGAGERGKGYAYYAYAHPDWLKVVSVAEPNEFRRNAMKERYKIPDENVFTDWVELANRPKLCDAIVIATLEHMHAEPTVLFSNLGYHILLEKPMANTIEDCRRITEAAIRNQITFAVGHVLRYTAHNKLIKRIIEKGLLGKIINIQHMEPVGFWHFAHSYVRGNWRNEKDSCFSLMTKCCHDIDVIMKISKFQDLVAHWVDSPCLRISSFGNLTHFHQSNKPKEAGDAKRCLECAAEPSCPYSAKKIYLNQAKRGNWSWPVSVVTDVTDIENISSALQNGPYGRCVYECDNDVADHQIVSMEFANGATVSVTMIAFTESICARKTRIFGTLGELECDDVKGIRFFDFLTQRRENMNPSSLLGVTELSGHGGGDFGLMESFVQAVSARITKGNSDSGSFIQSSAEETFKSHLYVFAAEHARRSGKVVDVEEFKREHGIKGVPLELKKPFI